jgi:uncharacterized protein
LQRIVRTPDGTVVVDATGRLAGRGAYVCRTGDCFAQALEKGAMGRALKLSLPAETRDALLAGIPTDMTIQGGARGQE